MRRTVHARDVGAPRSVASGPGRLIAVLVAQTQAVEAFVRLYDRAGGAVAIGVTSPLAELAIGASTSGSESVDMHGVPFGSGLTVTSATTDGGTTASAAGTHLTFVLEDEEQPPTRRAWCP